MSTYDPVTYLSTPPPEPAQPAFGVAQPEPYVAPAAPEPEPSIAPHPPKENTMQAKNVDESLRDAMNISGAIGAALVDYTSGMTLGTAGGGGLDLEVAAAGNTEVVRAKQAVMQQLGIDGPIEDMLITLDDQLHLIRLMDTKRGDGLFIYLVLNKAQSNLAMARRQLSDVEKNLAV